jgi:hypothetical protein
MWGALTINQTKTNCLGGSLAENPEQQRANCSPVIPLENCGGNHVLLVIHYSCEVTA